MGEVYCATDTRYGDRVSKFLDVVKQREFVDAVVTACIVIETSFRGRLR
jgi:hypothetical protein